MTNSVTKALLGVKKPEKITEIIVPQLEYYQPAFRSAGIRPIRFGDIFRAQKGREPKPGEYVKFVFQEGIRYRGAFGWMDRSNIVHNGTSYPVVYKPRASFMLGEGWAGGQYPGQMELYIPPNARIYGASGASKVNNGTDPGYMWNINGQWGMRIYPQDVHPDMIPGCIFSLQGTEAFINATTPLIFNHHGHIFSSGGTGANARVTPTYSIGPQGPRASGGCGKGWPAATRPTDDLATVDIFNESAMDSGDDTHNITANRPTPTYLVQEDTTNTGGNGQNSKYVYQIEYPGYGGSWGRVGQGILYYKLYNGNQSSAYNKESGRGGMPGAVFDLANFGGSPDFMTEYNILSFTTGYRFPNWASLAAVLDFSQATGKINLGTPEQWKTAPAINGLPNQPVNNLSWSWRQMMYRDCWGSTHFTKLFGSTYNPIEGYNVMQMQSLVPQYGLNPYRD